MARTCSREAQWMAGEARKTSPPTKLTCGCSLIAVSPSPLGTPDLYSAACCRPGPLTRRSADFSWICYSARMYLECKSRAVHLLTCLPCLARMSISGVSGCRQAPRRPPLEVSSSSSARRWCSALRTCSTTSMPGDVRILCLFILTDGFITRTCISTQPCHMH